MTNDTTVDRDQSNDCVGVYMLFVMKLMFS